jgi:hypothetical protein
MTDSHRDREEARAVGAATARLAVAAEEAA